MEATEFERVIKAWKERQKHNFSEETVGVARFMFETLAAGEPVSAEDLAAATGLPLEAIKASFRMMESAGADFDEHGNLSGNALTLKPTGHTFELDGRKLYAWCALDTLFLPGLLGKTAKVESTCPATMETVRLTISPQGVEAVDPPGTVISVVVPGVSAACEPGQGGGAEGAACSSMNFFASREDAERWLGPESDVLVLDLEDAWRLANEIWIRPYTLALGDRA